MRQLRKHSGEIILLKVLQLIPAGLFLARICVGERFGDHRGDEMSQL